jgi:predicted acetyltransferase
MKSDSERSSWIYLGESEPYDTPAKDFEAYVNKLRSTETNPLPSFVTSTCYWAVHKGEVIGRIAIRHELNDFLKKVGGHVGYIVRPSYRNRGVASEMLRLILETDRARSIGKILVTCDENNTASERTILKNGGILENITPNGDQPGKKRFWIDSSKFY